MKSVIFDLDGTILDTLDDLYNATNYVLSYNHLPVRTKEEVRRFVGNGIYNLVERAAPTVCPKPLVDLMFDDFCDYYKDHCSIATKPYDGIIEVIQSLKQKGIKVAVVSNKSDFAVQELCKQYFPNLFDYVLGSKDSIKKKPAPDMIEEVLKYFHISTTDAIYIGDSEVDIETCKNANMDLIVCSWGFRDEDFLLEHGATTIIHTPQELLKTIQVDHMDEEIDQSNLFIQPYIDLLNRITIQPHTILDLTNEYTSLLQERYPTALLENAIQDNKYYDLILLDSSISIIDQLNTYYDHLNQGGMIAMQVENQHRSKINKIIRNILSRYDLEFSFNTQPGKYEYYDLLSNMTDTFNLWQVEYIESIPSLKPIIEKWIEQVKPCIKSLDQSKQEMIIMDIKETIQNRYQVQKNGEIMIEIPRLFFTISH